MTVILFYAGVLVGALLMLAIFPLRGKPPAPTTIGTDVPLPVALCKATAYRRARFDPLNVRRLTADRTTSQENAS